MSRSRIWTNEEKEILINNYKDKTKDELLNLLPDRTWYQIQSKASNLKVKKYSEYKEPRKVWTEDEIINFVIERGYKYHGTYYDDFNKRKIIIECDKGITDHVYFDRFKNGSNAGSRNTQRNKSFDEVKEIIESDGYVVVSEGKDYKNSRSTIETICPNGHKYNTNYHNFHSGTRCNTCALEIAGKCNLLDLEKIKERFDKSNLKIINIESYKGVDTELECECKIHGNSIKISYKQLDYRKLPTCKNCLYDVSIENIKSRFLKIKEILNSKNLTLITTEKEYIDGKLKECQNVKISFICKKHVSKSIQTVNEKTITAKNVGAICSICAKDKIRGENHPLWNGGISSLTEYLRSKISIWKIDSFSKYNNKCYLTGKSESNVIHHLYSFTKLVKEVLGELNEHEVKQISEYTDEELNEITDKVLEKHYEYGLGVCLDSSVHDLFHLIYSKKNFTPDDFEEFKLRFKMGEFNELKINKGVV